MIGFREEETTLTLVLDIFGSFLSLCGAAFIIVMYLKFTQLRTFAFKMVMYLSLSDLIMCVVTEEDFLCILQAAVINFGELSSILWTTCISFSIYQSVVKGETRIQELYERKLQLFAIGLPLLASIIPIFTDSYGSNGKWCWIRMTKDDKSLAVLGLFEFYIPLWIAFVYNYFAYKAAIEFISSTVRGAEIEEACSQLSLYPKILLLCWFFATINRVWTVFFEPLLILDILHSLFAPWQGFLNAIVYGMSSSVRTALKAWSPFHKDGSSASSPITNQGREMKLLSEPMKISRDPSVNEEQSMRKSDIEIRNMMRMA